MSLRVGIAGTEQNILRLIISHLCLNLDCQNEENLATSSKEKGE